ncbi:hypothetical protein V7S79_02225 [Aquirufa sp. ROCK-SH2]
MIKFKLDSLIIILFSCLILPIVIFLFSWIHIALSLAFCSVLIYLYYQFIKQLTFIDFFEISYKDIFILSIGCLYIIYTSGIGGFTEQKQDLFFRSNLVYSHLIYNDWPVIVNQPLSEYNHFSYYLAYFLPTSFLYNLFDSFVSISFLELFWVFLIFFTSSLIFFSKYGYKYLLLFLILPNGIFWLFDKFIFNNILPFRYFSVITNLAHGPQQVLATFLGVIIIEKLIADKIIKWIPFIIVLVFFWSPFIAIGLFLLYLVPYFWKYKFLTSINLYSFILLMLFFMFFGSKNTTFHFYFVNFKQNWLRYLSFWMIDFGLLFYLFYESISKKNRNRIIYFTILLIVFSLFNFGKYNDFMNKTSIPVLFLFHRTLFNSLLNKRNYFLGLIIIAFSASSIKILLNYKMSELSMENRVKFYKGKNFNDLYHDDEVNSQFYSSEKSFYNTYLARKK